MRNRVLFKVLGRKYGFDMDSYRRLVAESMLWTNGQWEVYHDGLLSSIIVHAYNHVPYYRKLFDKTGIDPFSIHNERDLEQLPITRKGDLIEHPDLFVADNSKSYYPMHHHTGGTTGHPCPYLNDRKSWALNWAVKMHTFMEAGYRYGDDKLAVMAGGSLIPGKTSGMKHKLWRWANNYYSMPISHMTAQTMDEYIGCILREKIQFLRGYPSAVASFADYIVSTNRSVPLKAVFTTAEMLYPHQREIIRQAFGCDTWDSYGCGDGMGQATDCKEHDKMHVCEQVSIMQIVDKEGLEVRPGEEGEIVLTSLYDYAMPFIRYAPGDYAVKGEGKCVCGRQSKTINRIIGRSSDVFRFSNGRIINGLSFPIEELTNEVRRFQIVQVKKDAVEVLLEEKTHLSEERLTKLKETVEFHCGEGVIVEVKVVDKIVVPDSEKFRYVVSKLKE